MYPDYGLKKTCHRVAHEEGGWPWLGQRGHPNWTISSLFLEKSSVDRAEPMELGELKSTDFWWPSLLHQSPTTKVLCTNKCLLIHSFEYLCKWGLHLMVSVHLDTWILCWNRRCQLQEHWKELWACMHVVGTFLPCLVPCTNVNFKQHDLSMLCHISSAVSLFVPLACTRSYALCFSMRNVHACNFEPAGILFDKESLGCVNLRKLHSGNLFSRNNLMCC